MTNHIGLEIGNNFIIESNLGRKADIHGLLSPENILVYIMFIIGTLKSGKESGYNPINDTVFYSSMGGYTSSGEFLQPFPL